MKKQPVDPLLSIIVLISLATLAGGVIRLATPLTTDFPLNDGGLFYVMIKSLQSNHYALPLQFSYNGGGIPFTYPPLGFYLTGFITEFLQQSLLNVIRWLPAFISTLTIPAFFFLAREMSQSKATAILATFAFAFLPRSFDWLIMGGGVTRSFGFLFAILTLACAGRLFSSPRPNLFIWTSVCATLTVLAHPEALIHTALAAFLLFLFNRSRAGFVRTLMVAAITILLTSSWWALTLTRHGLEPFLAAAQATAGDRTDLFNLVMRFVLLFRFEFTDETFLPFIAIFGVIGLFAAVSQRKWFLPVWVVTSLLFEPRSAPLFISIPLSILSAETLSEIILPALQKTGVRYIPPVFLGLLLAYTITSAQIAASTVANDISVKPAEREAMEWIKINTPAESNFLVLTGRLPLRDPVSEWFPVLTDRISAATVYGYEWIANQPFSSRVDAYRSLQDCLTQNLDCIQKWSEENRVWYTHIMISEPKTVPLQIYLDASKKFTLIYRTPGISIYQKEQP